MSTLAPSETIVVHGCLMVIRRVEGAQSRELFFTCQPPTEFADADLQAEAIYRAALHTLHAEGGNFDSVINETLFLRDLRSNIEPVRKARRRVLDGDGGAQLPATTEIEQHPLKDGASLEVFLHAVLPLQGTSRCETVVTRPNCDCPECVSAQGLRIYIGDEIHLYAGSLCGAGNSAYEQTHNMFKLAEDLLQQAGMEFSDVVRTWIYLREMERDYGELNRARREFFEERSIDPVPASTAIGGGPVSEAHDLCLGIYAIKGEYAVERTVMTSPTLNEAPEYGADFVRGMRVAEANKISLLISGTASVDEVGDTAHVGDFEAQAERMLVNIAALLEGHGAGFQDIVFAITYLKHPANETLLRSKLQAAGFEGFPHIFVVAPVCRPELLCETEALAVLPVVAGQSAG